MSHILGDQTCLKEEQAHNQGTEIEIENDTQMKVRSI